MTTTTCEACGNQIELGAWPWCPHGQTREVNARRWDAIVVWASNSDPDQFSFPGQAGEPCPDGYHRVEITNLREADRFVTRMNALERRKIEGEREVRHALDDAGVKDRRAEEDARGWVMRGDGTKFYVRGNSRAEVLQRATREFTDRLRERRRFERSRPDPHFHINVLSFDAGHRNSYSGPETGWRERKP